MTQTLTAPAAAIPGKAGAGAADTGTGWVEGGGVGLSPSLEGFSFSIQVSKQPACHIPLDLLHQKVILRQERKVEKNLQC